MDLEKIGKFIAKCRKDKKMTQVMLASELGISDRAISKWENGKSMPDVSLMLDLCGILDIDVNELLIGERLDMSNYKEVANKNMISTLESAKKEKDNYALAMTIISVISVIIAISIYVYFLRICEVWVRILRLF